METNARFYSLSFGNIKTYLFAFLFIAGNILLTAAHKYPNNARLFRQAVDGNSKRNLVSSERKKIVRKKAHVSKNPKKQPRKSGKTKVRKRRS